MWNGSGRNDGMSSEEWDILSKIARSSHFAKELVEFAKDNFSGKVSCSVCWEIS
jgi:hypothetical protein